LLQILASLYSKVNVSQVNVRELVNFVDMCCKQNINIS